MDTYFGLKLSILIFSMTLQSINTLANDGFFAVEVCIKALQRIRTDELFLKFLKWFATKQPISVILRFYPERDKSLEELMMVPVFPTIEDLYRKEYYQAIDCVKGELSFCEKHRKNVD